MGTVPIYLECGYGIAFLDKVCYNRVIDTY